MVGMIQSFSFEQSDLKIGQYKSITPQMVTLEIETYDDDEFRQVKDDKEYLDGVRIQGELIIDVPFGNKILRKGMTGVLRVTEEGENSSFNILLVEETGVEVIVPNKIRRYFWHFYGIGKAIRDELELLPENITDPTKMKVFHITDFEGHYVGAGVSAIVVARDRAEARQLLDIQLDEMGLGPKNRLSHFTVVELDMSRSHALVVQDGSK